MNVVKGYAIKPVAVDDVIPLRMALLRQGMPRDASVFEGDDEPTTVHFGAFVRHDSAPVGIVTLVRRPFVDAPERPALQLRGMAVLETLQMSGCGRALVEQCIAYAGERRFALIWCNARTPAEGFYKKFGFRTVSDVFEIPTAGPHVRMVRWFSSPAQ